MDQKNDRTPGDRRSADPPRPTDSSPVPRKRFRIEKIEERIAPKKGGSSAGGGGTELSGGLY
jgi:hypothetical protein